jgi:hypothetical protein
VRKTDNLYVSIVLKSGSLTLLEPSGPVKACNGIALPHYIINVVTFLYVSITFCDHLQGGVFTKDIWPRGAGRVARIGERRGEYCVWWGNLRERDHWGDPGVDGMRILRWVLR